MPTIHITPKLSGKPPKFGTLNKQKIGTYPTRIPTFFNKNLLHAFITQILLPLMQEDPDRFLTLQDVKDSLPSTQVVSFDENAPGGFIEITPEDVQSANNRALGFIAYKLGLQAKPTEVKGSDRSQIIEQILTKI